MQANVILNAKVRYIDEDELRDKEDDIIPTVSETWSRTHARLKLYLSVDLATLRFGETELLTRELIVE